MSEAYVPVPDPEPDSNWDPHPARCPECSTIIDAHPASRKDSQWEGHCPEHGIVVATYRISDSEMPDEEEK
jgi:uncharacterized radical SAM superfamily Fe-S cluster-containing enzyme